MIGADAEKVLPDAPSVPGSTAMDVYNSVSAIPDSGLPAHLKSTVNGADAAKVFSDVSSMPAPTVMGVYHSALTLMDSGVPANLRSTGNGADADKALPDAPSLPGEHFSRSPDKTDAQVHLARGSFGPKWRPPFWAKSAPV